MKRVFTFILGMTIMLLFGFQKPAENIEIEKELGYKLPEIQDINYSNNSEERHFIDFDEWTD